jgi:hypothetical protein
MLQQYSSSPCIEGSTWRYSRNSIIVRNGCQARFGYGYGNVSGDYSGDSGGGTDTGAVVGGIALAAGLIALLTAAGKSSSNSRSAPTATTASATVTADLNKFPGDARASGDACMKEAGRQVGSTGGKTVRLDSVDRVERSGQGWIILARITGTWPEHNQAMTMDCRATGSSVTAFDVR